MNIHLYWVSALTYAIVIGMILFSDIKFNKISDNKEKKFRLMAIWIMFFCLQDAVWGLCDARIINSDIVFFISSSVFHISTVVTTFFWLNYVLEYLGDKIKHKIAYLMADGIVIACQFILVIVNIFKTTIFTIEDGSYITGFLRTFAFVNQYIVYLLIGITTLFFVVKKETRNNSNYRSVFYFTIAPILLGVFQLLYPNAPFYSMGYFFGFFIIHIFVVAKDKEDYLKKDTQLQKIIELNNELKSKQVEIDGQFEILRGMARTYDYINLLDLKAGTATRFDIKDYQEETFDLKENSHTSLNKRVAQYITDSDYERFWAYTNLATLDKRLKGKRYISEEFVCKEEEWIQAMYVRMGDDVKAPVSKVAYTLLNITKDRKREYQVYSALTNLVYSLHIFDLENNTFESLIESGILSELVGNETNSQRMADILMRGTCKDEYLEAMLEFVNLSTVAERLKGKNYLSREFVGKYNGWTRMTFVPIEMKKDVIKKLVVTTQIIDSEKNEIMELIYKSTTDELTRLYNRRCYEDDLDHITKEGDLRDCIIIALDVNGLKTVNDTLGHNAGDELIIGAGKCINSSFVSVGKSYRTGGDEFMAIVRCDEERIQSILADFETMVGAWKGKYVEKMTISYGYASAKAYPDLTVRELASEADKHMYESKTAYYIKNGIERRK